MARPAQGRKPQSDADRLFENMPPSVKELFKRHKALARDQERAAFMERQRLHPNDDNGR